MFFVKLSFTSNYIYNIYFMTASVTICFSIILYDNYGLVRRPLRLYIHRHNGKRIEICITLDRQKKKSCMNQICLHATNSF